MVTSRKPAERSAGLSLSRHQASTLATCRPSSQCPTRLQRPTTCDCFRRGHRLMTRTTVQCLFVTMILLVVLTMMSQTLRTMDSMTQRQADTAVRLNQAPRWPGGPHQHKRKPSNTTHESHNAKPLNQAKDVFHDLVTVHTLLDNKEGVNNDGHNLHRERLGDGGQMEGDEDNKEDMNNDGHNLHRERLGDGGQMEGDERLGDGGQMEGDEDNDWPPVPWRANLHGHREAQDRRRAEYHAQRQKERAMYSELLSLLFDSEDFQDRQEVDNTNGEERHVFFLKVHKATSTTVVNVLYRFAFKRHLHIMFPLGNNAFSENSRNWRRNTMPFDILCNHLVFREQTVRARLPADTKFIGIVREPFAQFVSAFMYYRTQFRLPYLANIPGADPIASYLRNPKQFETRTGYRSYTHNRMSFDFGMDPRLMEEESYITEHVNYLNRTFDLVMVSERFDESMVLLKRLLGWRLQDILYIQSDGVTDRDRQYTAEEKDAHRRFNAADYALYDHFSRLFQTRVEAEGPLFAKEVATYVTLRETVGDFCRGGGGGGGTDGHYSVPATAWTPVFVVRKIDCMLMTLPEIPLVKLAKRLQRGSRFLPMEHRRVPMYPVNNMF